PSTRWRAPTTGSRTDSRTEGPTGGQPCSRCYRGRPRPPPLPDHLADRPGDAIERLVPGGVAPRVVGAHIAQARTKDAHRVVDDLPGGLATDAKKAAAVGVLVVSAD